MYFSVCLQSSGDGVDGRVLGMKIADMGERLFFERGTLAAQYYYDTPAVVNILCLEYVYPGLALMGSWELIVRSIGWENGCTRGIGERECLMVKCVRVWLLWWRD